MAYVFALLIVVAEVINVAARTQLHESAQRYREESFAREVKYLAQASARYLTNTGEVPASLNDIASQAEYAHLRFYDKQRINAARSNTITDGRYQYQRFLVYGQPGIEKKGHLEFINANQCGANFNSRDWCGDRSSYWFVSEERTIYRNIESVTNRQVEKTFISIARKLAYGEAPKTLASGAEMSDGDTVNLAAAVGYGGSASNCRGAFSFEGVTLDCRSLFDVYGNPITYTRLSAYGFAVAAELNAKYSDGSNILVVKAGEFQ